jgi:gamma-glutamyltranspeptidase/glutathione hydrolase
MSDLGAVASGHAGTSRAGVEILEGGGNAVDAIVAAALAAGVCEPLLTGLGGGGLMTIRSADGAVVVADCFSLFPGLEHGLEPREFNALDVDYGPTTQTFFAGRGSAAVPGVAPGLEAVWKRYGSLPLETIAAPAIRLAEEGWVATEATCVVATMLRDITALTEESQALFQPGGRPLQPGDHVVMPAAANALRAFAADGAAPFVSGRYAQDLVATFGPPHGSLGLDDLEAFQPRFVAPLSVPFCGSTLYVPAPPCSGGALIAFGLQVFERVVPDSPNAQTLARCFAEVMAATERARQEGFDEKLMESGAVETLLSDASIARHSAAVEANLRAPTRAVPVGVPQGSQPGNTTHISTVDAQGMAVSFTSSNGETCGTLWPGLEFPVNNFLGEGDIHPLGFHRGPAGSRFRTGMTPALLVDAQGGVMALGTGGSNRIRTAMFQVIRHITYGGMDVEEAVMAPRIHVEGASVEVENIGQDEAVLKAAASSGRQLARFEGRHLYFGGVHSARRRSDGSFEAFGDPRRSGVGTIARRR